MTDLPIFPLNTVLFPGGVLPLRVFETRYMDMVRECMRTNSRFGVCLIQQGAEVARRPGEAAIPEPIGCTAEITDWDMRDPGVLGITTRGHERFRIMDREVQSNGLIRAEVRMINADAHEPVPEQHAGCALLLSRVIADLQEQHAQAASELGDESEGVRVFPFAEPYDFNDASWVANRLCEVLQVPLRAKQKLMELRSGVERLSIVDTWLKQQSVIANNS
ncbi:MAG TPA: LON peptidase substrate-binding domain-containing protein [Burkholderiaceae bacterium]|nr:LON peptidase substrate-binding domain-containing protein [Burkholderiaceae bacterium]